MIRSSLRDVVRISHVRRLLAALAALAVTVKLSMLRDSGGGLILDPILEGSVPSSMVDLLATHNLLRLSSGQSVLEYESPLRGGGSTISLSSVRRTSGVSLEEADFLGKISDSERSSLPSWIKNYLSWHDQQLKRIKEDNWKEFRYLVFRCRRQDAKCGGASDRLKPIPYGLMLANQTRRVLLIDWDRPCRLEEFLVPPPGGINWTVPSFVRFNYPANPSISMSLHSEFAFGDDMLIDIRHQARDAPSYYDDHRDDPSTEPNFKAIYHLVWRLFFTPSPGVATALHETQRGYRLVPNRYVSVHIRAIYTAYLGSSADMVRNAVRCANRLRPGSPIFVASDSRVASSYAINYGREIGVKVVAHVPDAPPLHIDRGQNFLSLAGADWMQRNASDFYDTFVDLYLLAGGSCTAYNIGGYGRWASLIGPNSSCFIKHHVNLCSYSGTTMPSSNATDLPPMAAFPRQPALIDLTESQQEAQRNRGSNSTPLLSLRKKAPGWVKGGGNSSNPSPG